jgi:hypothetical protein
VDWRAKKKSIVSAWILEWVCEKDPTPEKQTVFIKILLNKVELFKSFVYASVPEMLAYGIGALVTDIVLRLNSPPEDPECGKSCTVCGYLNTV